MSTTKHTPGPWEVSGDGVSVTMKDNGQHVVAVAKAPQWLTGEEAEANAALIAAAPDGLEAGKLAASVIDELLNGDGMTASDSQARLDEALTALNAFIRKSEGR